MFNYSMNEPISPQPFKAIFRSNLFHGPFYIFHDLEIHIAMCPDISTMSCDSHFHFHLLCSYLAGCNA